MTRQILICPQGRERSRANGLVMSSNTLGPMIAPILFAAIMATFGWRQAFVVISVPGFLVAIAVFFPVIINKGKKGNYDKMNYEPREKLCNPACALGKKLEVPTYEFLKEPIIRKYGEAFYQALDHVAKMKENKKSKAVK